MADGDELRRVIDEARGLVPGTAGSDRVDVFAAVHDAASGRADFEVPDAWLVRAKGIAGAPGPSLGERLLAALSFDSWAQAAVGVRSAATASRDLEFEAGGLVVEVRLERAGAGLSVVGLVRQGETVVPVTVRDADGGPWVAAMPSGEFALTVPPGATLEIDAGDHGEFTVPLPSPSEPRGSQ